ncbi:formamidase, partial [Priestia flexa]|nr:formamidase [Priestia flexa]MCA1204173.1 formamidase [Priestia flexa]
VKDLAEGNYKLPWEDKIKIKDGSIYGYPVKNTVRS